MANASHPKERRVERSNQRNTRPHWAQKLWQRSATLQIFGIVNLLLPARTFPSKVERIVQVQEVSLPYV